MEKNLLYKLISPYKCKVCGQDMLFFETIYNKLIDYKPFLDNGYSLDEMKRIIETRKIKYIRCICCGKSFIIDWTNGWPEQLIDREALKKFGL